MDGLSGVVSGWGLLDAHLDIDGVDIIFHSRGGARGDIRARNSDYGRGLRLILERLRSAGIEIQDAWVDSSRVQHLPVEARRIFESADRISSPLEQYQLLTSCMKSVGRAVGGTGGNSTKRICIRLDAKAVAKPLQGLLGLRESQAR